MGQQQLSTDQFREGLELAKTLFETAEAGLNKVHVTATNNRQAEYSAYFTIVLRVLKLNAEELELLTGVLSSASRAISTRSSDAIFEGLDKI